MMKKLWLSLGWMVLVLTALAVPAVVFADAPVEGRAERAEVRFLEGMIDHHQMALDMANDCLTKATTESVTTLCQNIIDAQSAEIALMQGWLLDWYNIDYSPMSMDNMMGMSARPQMEQMSGMMGMEMSDEMRAQMEQMSGMMDMMMPGMGGMDHGGMNMEGMPSTDPAMMMGMMAGFNRLEGVDYEIAWLESMIDHHDDAIHMSQRLLDRVPADTGHADLLTLAQQIIEDQSTEIEAMELLITDLSA
jgi:uncharacterized protein (DUF305 family)